MKKMFSIAIAFIGISAYAQAPMSTLDNAVITDLPSLEEGIRVFNNLRDRTARFGQCYNRAHAWSYDMLKEEGIHSRKVLIYYSNKYRKELDNKWGYHIAPLVRIQGKDYAFDKEFHDRPYEIQDWVKWFVGHGENKLANKRNKLVAKKQKSLQRIANLSRSSSSYYSSLRRHQEDIAKIDQEMRYLEVTDTDDVSINCKEITTVGEWDRNPFDGYCMYQVIGMYYRGPPQLRDFENRGIVLDQFDMKEVWDARAQAFRDYKKQWSEEQALREAEKEAERRAREQRRR